MSIASVRRKYEQELMRLPNVNGVGIGEKAGKAVIKVFVTHKVPVTDLQPHEVIPSTIEGWEIDVEEIGVVRVQSR
jgi:hypothetical protein